jgi:hypothetical protein
VPRDLTSDWITHASATQNRPILLFEGVFNGSTLRIWNGIGDLSWDSHTWDGNGWLQGFDGGDETTEVEAVDMSVTLSGLPEDVIALVLAAQVQGAAGTLYFGFLDSADIVVPDPTIVWKGKYSHAEVSEDGDVSTARLYYDSPLSDMDRPREGRWTDQCQQDLFPGDKGFEYVVAASRWHGDWNNKKQKVNKGSKRNSNKKGSGKKH